MKSRLSLILIFFLSCSFRDDFDLQGHRGAVGLFPENSIIGFIEIVKLGVTTLEMDVVITKDNKVLVSHEPWISNKKCIDIRGNDISDDISTTNIFLMTYDEIKNFDCGSLPNPNHPGQKKISAIKPLLREVISRVEEVSQSKIKYNIEIKSQIGSDQIFHPKFNEFVDLVVHDIKSKNIEDRVTIQSFDFRVLKYLKNQYPSFKISMLVNESYDYSNILDDLGFYPDIYSPNFKNLSYEIVKKIQEKKIQIIPWTVNSYDDITMILEWDVDGIISDYPDRVIYLLDEKI